MTITVTTNKQTNKQTNIITIIIIIMFCWGQQYTTLAGIQ
jgi:hypothetical protein